ncbi:MAG: hypothetical protein ABIG61_07235 [Planctomycetota bacterium]
MAGILTIEQESMTSVELTEDFKANPTGSIVGQKIRRRVIEVKLQTEQQAIAVSVVNAKLFPKAVCEYGEDGDGRFAKVYFNGKAEIVKEEN